MVLPPTPGACSATPIQGRSIRPISARDHERSDGFWDYITRNITRATAISVAERSLACKWRVLRHAKAQPSAKPANDRIIGHETGKGE